MLKKSNQAVIETADRFELLAGDLIHRLRIRDRQPGVLDDEVRSAMARLEKLIREHQVELARPLADQSAMLIERQGEQIRQEQEKAERAELRYQEEYRRAESLADDRERLKDELVSERERYRGGVHEMVERLLRAAEDDVRRGVLPLADLRAFLWAYVDSVDQTKRKSDGANGTIGGETPPRSIVT